MGIYNFAIATLLMAYVGRPALAQAQDQKIFSVQTPAVTNIRDGVNYELGMRFTATAAGKIKAIRFYKASNESGIHTGRIFSASGQQLAAVTFVNETASGWQQQALVTPLSISANTEYVVSVNTANQYYVVTNNGLASQVSSANLRSVVGNNGVYGPVGSKPASSWQNSNYFRDVVYAADAVTVPPQTRIWNNSAFASRSGNFNVSFDAVPTAAMGSEDAVIGLSAGAADAYSDLAAIVRFGANGIDARNGGSYAPAPGFAYSAGAKYRFEIAVDLTNKRYTVKVGPSGGTLQTLASNFAFRTEQAAVTSLANLAHMSEQGGVTVSNFVVSAGTAPEPEPVPPVTPAPGAIGHGKDLTLSMVGPAAIGITSFTTGSSGRQISGTATYDGFTVTGPHLLIQGAMITGGLDISSSQPVVVRGCKVYSSGYWGINTRSGKILLLYNEIGGSSSSSGPDTGLNVGSDNLIAFRNRITYMKGDGISVGGKGAQILENYVHNFVPSPGAHHDGLQATGSNNGMFIARNKILVQLNETGAINLGAWVGALTEVKVDSNYLAGGSFTFYGNGGTTTNVSVTNNIFGTDFYPNSGIYGAAAYWQPTSGCVWSNNKFLDGRVVNP